MYDLLPCHLPCDCFFFFLSHLRVNVPQAAAGSPSASSTAAGGRPSPSTDAPRGGVRGGRRGWVHLLAQALVLPARPRLAVVTLLLLQQQPCALLGVTLLVLCVHGHEAQHHQVEEGADHRQARQDVDEAERHVRVLVLQRVRLLREGQAKGFISTEYIQLQVCTFIVEYSVSQ